MAAFGLARGAGIATGKWSRFVAGEGTAVDYCLRVEGLAATVIRLTWKGAFLMAFRSCALTALVLTSDGICTPAAVAQTVATRPGVSIPASCRFSRPARVIRSMRERPEIVAAFRLARWDVADAGEPFAASDIVDEASRHLPHRQFIRAYDFGDRIIVWYYRARFMYGSIAQIDDRLVVTGEPERRMRIDPSRILSGPFCKATQALLDEVYSNPDDVRESGPE